VKTNQKGIYVVAQIDSMYCHSAKIIRLFYPFVQLIVRIVVVFGCNNNRIISSAFFSDK